MQASSSNVEDECGAGLQNTPEVDGRKDGTDCMNALTMGDDGRMKRMPTGCADTANEWTKLICVEIKLRDHDGAASARMCIGARERAQRGQRHCEPSPAGAWVCQASKNRLARSSSRWWVVASSTLVIVVMAGVDVAVGAVVPPAAGGGGGRCHPSSTVLIN